MLDAIVKFEDTSFTEDTVTVFAPSKEGSNIVPVGEDVKEGELVVEKGRLISPALVGLFAGLRIRECKGAQEDHSSTAGAPETN